MQDTGEKKLLDRKEAVKALATRMLTESELRNVAGGAGTPFVKVGPIQPCPPPC